MTMRLIATAFLTLLLLLVPALSRSAEKAVAKNSAGITAVFKADPSKGLIDLYLRDARTSQEITEAEVSVVAAMPDGSRIKKDMMGMKMKDGYSFMNSLDMSVAGRYIFDISVKTGKKNASFKFTYDRK